MTRLRPLGEIDNSRRFDLAIGLPLRNREALTNLLEELYDPAGPNYHKFLTPEQFTEKFGPTEDDYQAVIAFVKSNHFVLTGRHPNRLLVDVNATAADIERALHLKLRIFQHPSEPRAFYAPDSEPSLNSQLAILSIQGLDDFSPPRPMDLHFSRPSKDSGIWPRRPLSQRPLFGRRYSALETQSGAILDATGSGPSGSFIGLDFRNAYAPGVLLDGAGESVGLVALDNYYPTDVTTYEDLAGLPRVAITNVFVNGFNRPPGLNNGEVALDIEMAVAMAPGLSKVIVYMGAVPNDVLNRMATDNQARQLSSSWTFGKQVDPVREQIYQQFAAQGQTMFQASGDAGAYGGALFAPADDPYVTSVGGTALVANAPGGAWSSETAWFGSGGGISGNYPIPAWQKVVANSANQGSATMRNVPDVAGPADATVWVIANNGEQGTVGGTSVAAPLWAGFAALVNQQAAANHQPPIGFLNPAIYAIGQGPAYSSAFHDITSGNNTNADSPSRFFAVAGYDLCTGWGSPTGSNLVNALLTPPDALQISPGSSQVASGVAGGPFGPAFQGFSLSNAGLSSLSWTLGTTSTWLRFSASAGALAPKSPGTNVDVLVAAETTTFLPGSYSAEIWFTNLNNGFSQLRRLTLNVVTPPVITVAPVDQRLPAGAPAQFSVQTLSNAMLSFHWQAHGSNLLDGPDISGSSTPGLRLNHVALSDNGNYLVLVSNVAGSTLSPAALLLVTSSPPIIVTQPIGQTILPGAGAIFTVSAYGDSPLTYRWRANGSDLADGPNLSGTASNTLALLSISARDAGTYSVVVSNASGSLTSADAILNVVPLTSSELVQDPILVFNANNGSHPNGLARAMDGTIYGTTQHGGVGGAGTVFRLDPNGSAHVLYSFNGLNDGDQPNEDLFQASDRSLFGTTFGGGTNGFGTVFKLSTNGQLTTLFTFDHTNGVLPAGGLLKAGNGSFYGTASEGGVFHYGTLFRLDANDEFDVVVAFNSTNGAFPHAGLALGLDGNFYGTTYKGGAFGKGTIFKISPAGLLTTLVSFDGANGAFPVGLLTGDLDGTFVGTTTAGGSADLGTVFRIAPDATLTNLVSFSGLADGSHPRAGLLRASDGNWYGSTSDGGSFGDGTLFRLTPDGAFTTISQFDGYNGANPDAALIEDQDGSLLGVTRNGGPNGQGAIFRLAIPSLTPQITGHPSSVVTYAGSTIALSVATLASSPVFYQWHSNETNSVDGPNIFGSASRVLILTNITAASSGTYSVTVSNALGSVTSAQATVQVLVSGPFITLQPTNQVLAPGAIATFKASALGNLPLVYQWRVNGTNLLDSGNILGATTDTLIITNVTEANNGTYTLNVTNALGQTNSIGALLSVVPVTAPGTRLATLHWFTGANDGRVASELTDGGDGNLYGTTRLGGVSHNGTVFRVSTNGGLNTLAAFNQTNGAFPLAGLVRATNGLLYGTTSTGGAAGLGTVFTMTSDGAVTTLRDFTGGVAGASPSTLLLQAKDGNLYGSASDGGAAGFGTIFRIKPEGSFSTIYSFSGGADSGSPGGALLDVTGGDLFGLTPAGGAFDQGRVFKLTPGGALSTSYSFTGDTDGYDPVGALVQGDDGSLFGVTRLATFRGFTFYGTIFKINTNGSLNTLYMLNFSDGSLPAAGLVLGSDGNFYGTTEQGGANDNGTVFRITPGGVFSTLVEFDGFNDGSAPLTALTQGPDGSLYGTTSKGGVQGFGTIFKLAFNGPPQITQQPVSQVGFTGGTIGFSVAVSGGSPLSYLWRKDGTNLTETAFVQGASARVLTLNNLTLNDSGSYSVTVTNALGKVASAAAQLTIKAAPPKFQSVSQSEGNLVLTWSTTPGRTYQLQSRSDLASGAWGNLGVPATATGPSLQSFVPIGPASHQLYRVIMLP